VPNYCSSNPIRRRDKDGNPLELPYFSRFSMKGGLAMTKRSSVLIFMFLLLALSCGRSESPLNRDLVQYQMAPSPAPAPSQETPGPDPAMRRYIAVRHMVLVEMAETELPKGWQAVGEFCQTIRCEIVASSIRQKTQDSPPSASLTLRVAPEDVKQLFEQLVKVGDVVEHKTESEDKTGTVIDVEAKIKNLTELRDRLRNMLTSPNGTLKDVVEVERELSRAQTDLDSLQMRRKALANETEKVFVDISFRSRRSVAETGTFAPIVAAWHEAGHVLAESIAFAITFVVAIVPWLLLFVPVIWLSIRAFRRVRATRLAKKKS
jgi:Domain of unknown function (DUF4349)